MPTHLILNSTTPELRGNTWVSGNQGYATDLSPNASQRFYRVAAF